jgi:hypothetical protein
VYVHQKVSGGGGHCNVQNTEHKLEVLEVPPVNSLVAKLDTVFFDKDKDFTFLFFMT